MGRGRMPVKRVLLLGLLFICSAPAARARLDGSVFLFPISDNSFRSWGESAYIGTLKEVVQGTVLTGTHSVEGPVVFEMPVHATTQYSAALEGPTQPGACYGTTLVIHGVPPSPYPPDDMMWRGPSTKCAPTAPQNPDENNTCPGAPGCNSPILLDLAQDKYVLTSFEDGVRFDLRNEGVRKQTAWTRANAENAFLAMDRDGNGQIDNGAELFGNYTPLRSGKLAQNGFEALDELDDNRDGVVDAADSAWTALLLWTDRNHDGQSSADELRPIAISAVTAMETDYAMVGKKDQWGNLYRFKSRFQLRERDHTYYDVFLRSAP